MKEEEVIILSKQCNFHAVKASSLKQEASGREYWRIIDADNNSMVLCYLEPSRGDHSNFIAISEELIKNNISCSKIVHHNEVLGVTIQNDLGDGDLLSVLDEDNKFELLKSSLRMLSEIQNSKIDNINRFTNEELVEQMNLFKDIFCSDFLNVNVDSSIDNLITTTSNSLFEHPWVNCHFDFERRNLILDNNNELTVIDFQDMRIGPIGIDLAGILVDHYHEVDLRATKDLLKFYSKQVKLDCSENDFFEFLRWGTIQRNLRILGTLSNLYLTKNRTFRLKDLSMILFNLIQMIPENHASKEYLINAISPKLTIRVSEI